MPQSEDDRSGKFVYDSTDTPRPPLHVVAPAATANVAFHVVTLCGTSIEISRAVRRRVGCEVYPHMLACHGCAQRRPDLYPEWEHQPPPVHYRIGADMRSGVPVVCGQFVVPGLATQEWDDVTCPKCAGARPKQPPPVLTVHELQDTAGKHLREADRIAGTTTPDFHVVSARARLSLAATALADQLARQTPDVTIAEANPVHAWRTFGVGGRIVTVCYIDLLSHIVAITADDERVTCTACLTKMANPDV